MVDTAFVATQKICLRQVPDSLQQFSIKSLYRHTRKNMTMVEKWRIYQPIFATNMTQGNTRETNDTKHTIPADASAQG